MEIKNLYTVKAIIETGSYFKAAIKLNYAQSTITFQVQQLEKELGFQLFERKGKQMTLSNAGKEVMPLINQIIQNAEDLMHFKDQYTLTGRLSIAVAESIITYKLQPILAEFKRRAPEVDLKINVLNCYKISELVEMGEVDLGIHYDVIDRKNVIKTRIRQHELVLVGAVNLSEDESDYISPNQIKSMGLIQNDKDALYLKIFADYLKERNIIMNADIELWSIEAIKRSVQSNIGVAFLPRFTVEEEIETGYLKELPTGILDYDFTSSFSYKSSNIETAAFNLFKQLLEEIDID